MRRKEGINKMELKFKKAKDILVNRHNLEEEQAKDILSDIEKASIKEEVEEVAGQDREAEQKQKMKRTEDLLKNMGYKEDVKDGNN